MHMHMYTERFVLVHTKPHRFRSIYILASCGKTSSPHEYIQLWNRLHCSCIWPALLLVCICELHVELHVTEFSTCLNVLLYIKLYTTQHSPLHAQYICYTKLIRHALFHCTCLCTFASGKTDFSSFHIDGIHQVSNCLPSTCIVIHALCFQCVVHANPIQYCLIPCLYDTPWPCLFLNDNFPCPVMAVWNEKYLRIQNTMFASSQYIQYASMDTLLCVALQHTMTSPGSTPTHSMRNPGTPTVPFAHFPHICQNTMHHL